MTTSVLNIGNSDVLGVLNVERINIVGGTQPVYVDCTNDLFSINPGYNALTYRNGVWYIGTNVVYHSGNSSAGTGGDANSLPLTGGTLTGDLIVPNVTVQNKLTVSSLIEYSGENFNVVDLGDARYNTNIDGIKFDERYFSSSIPTTNFIGNLLVNGSKVYSSDNKPLLSELGAAPITHNHQFSEIEGKPTTLAGYGITDAAELVHSHDQYFEKTGGDISGNITLVNSVLKLHNDSSVNYGEIGFKNDSDIDTDNYLYFMVNGVLSEYFKWKLPKDSLLVDAMKLDSTGLYVFNERVYTSSFLPTLSELGAAGAEHEHTVVTTTNNGFMSSTDKIKLDSLSVEPMYVHPTGDGNLHVPATGDLNFGKVLMAGSIPGEIYWGMLSVSNVSGVVPETRTINGKELTTNIQLTATDLNIPVYGDATIDESGLMSASDKVKLDGLGNYIHPLSGVTTGTYKSVTVDEKGHITAGSNPTTLAGYGITDAAPSSHVGATGTAHGVATTSVAGFMDPLDKVKLDSLSNYTHPVSGVTTGTYKSVTVDEKGHITAGTNPTTLAGYGITDATASSHVGSTGTAHGLATTSVAGFMDPLDKVKLDSLSNYTHPVSVVTAGTYRSVTVDEKGHITAGSNPTTLAGYGITDAVINTRTINGKALSSDVTLTANDIGAADKSLVTGSVDGLMSASDKVKLDSLSNYTHPASGVTTGTYKSVTVDVNGHVTAGSNPTTLSGYGITDAAPSSHIGSTGTAHGLATTSVDGFMSAADKVKLDSLSNYTHPASGVTTGTYKSVTVDENGHITAGSNPTTLSGYGITDAVINTRTINGKALSSDVTLTAVDVNAIPNSLYGSANGVATLDENGKLLLTQVPSGIGGGGGGLEYRGAWNANDNIPALSSTVPESGVYYVVSVSGTTELSSLSDWNVGDWVISNGTEWQKIDQSNSVTSVNGMFGSVVITKESLGVPIYGIVSDSVDGLMSVSDKVKLDSLSNYTHPVSGVTTGTYRSVTVDENGHVTAGSNPTTLSGYGITDATASSHVGSTGTAHGVATTSVAGFMDPLDKVKLDSLSNYTHPVSGVTTGTYRSVTVDENGHITAGSNPTTLAGYGITDATASSHVGSTGTAHGVATTSVAGFMDPLDKVKLDGLNNYTHPLSGVTAGTYKSVTVDENGHITAGTNPTTLAGYGITDAAPSSHVGATGTAHGVASTSVAGFMSSSDKTKLDGISAGANAYTHPTSGVTAGTYRSVTVNAQGHITAGTNPTTLAGYGITDAVINTRTINGKALSSDVTLTVSDLGFTTTSDVWNATGTTAGTGFAFNGKTVIGGINNNVLTLNPFSSFTSGISTPTNINTETGFTVGSVFSVDSYGNILTTGKLTAGDIYNPTNMSIYCDYNDYLSLGVNVKYNGASWIKLVDSSPSYRLLVDSTGVRVTKSDGTTSDPNQYIGYIYSELNKPTLADLGAAPSSHVGGTGTAHGVASTSVAGFMSSTDKTKLDGISGTNTGDQTITLTGDVTGSGTGSFAATLVNSGVTAGIYSKVTVDAKGRVTAGASLAASDIPSLNWSKITSGKPTTLSGYGITDAVLSSDVVTTAAASKILKLDANSKLPASITGDADGNAATATKLATARTINGVSFDGSANITINAVDSTSRIASSEKGVANGVATLGADGKIFSSQLPSYVDDVLEYTNLAAFPTTGEAGKIYVALDTNKTYRWSGSVYVYITSGAVDSVAGKTGVVTLVKDDVGLSNVDNTSDLSKPISTAQQSALNLKANLVSPALTGTPSAPTATVGTSTTQIATTAFVNAEIANDAAPKSHVGATGTAHGVASTSVAGFMSSTDKTKLDGIATGANAYVHPTSGVTAGTYKSVTVDVNGHITAGTNPTTLAGYGIIDALGISANAVSASKWATARTLTFTGGSTGTGSIDGSGNVSIAMTVPPTGHVHALSTISDSPYKEAADVATPVALTVTATATTLTNSGTLAALVLDGVTCTAGMRVLVKEQATSAQNGLYTVTNAGSASVAWVLTRSADADTSAELAGTVVTVDQGTANGGKLFTTSFKKTDTIGTASVLWVEVVDSGNFSTIHPTSGIVAGTYRSITFNNRGHAIAGTNPTTLAGYGITDAAPSSHVGATGTAHGVATTSVAGFMSSSDKTKLDGIAAGANAYTHPTSGVTAGTYRSVTVDVNGHITAGTNPTTLAGYGITDAAASSHTHSYLPLTGGTCTGEVINTSANAYRLVNGNYGVITRNDGSNYYVLLTASGDQYGSWNTLRPLSINLASGVVAFGNGLSGSLTGNASTATALQTARTIALGGDFTGSKSFDGTGNITITGTLANSGVTAGTYRSVTVDAKGRVTAGTNPTTLAGYGITDAVKTQSSINFGGSATAITTDDFITQLTNLGAFNSMYWCTKAGWSYAGNNYITDTGVGTIQLAGCTVEVIGGSASTYTVRIHTAPTVSISGAAPNADFVYVNHGSGYSPKWHRIYSTEYKPTAADVGALPTTGGTLTGPVSLQTIQGQGSSIGWGSLDVTGIKGGYAGIHFPSVGYWFGVTSNGLSGVWDSTGASKWYFNESGALTGGAKVPWGIVYDTPGSTDWASKNSIGVVSGQLAWKNYGNGHVIFDASAGTSPSGTTIDKTNPNIGWSATYPTLMGWNGTNTYGVRVDSARVADYAANANLLDGNDSSAFALVGHTHSYMADGGTYGTLNLDNWIRTNGATGWYSSTYGGGIYMTDSTYVRIYNDKRFFVNSTAADAISTGGGIVANGRIQATGSGNDYHTGGFETRGNGSTNTIYPGIGFHQPGVFAGSLQMRNGTNFAFYQQGGSSYANVYANVFYGALSGNASTATKLATARTITIGSASATFDGSSNISFTLDSIGATSTSSSAINVANGYTASSTNVPNVGAIANVICTFPAYSQYNSINYGGTLPGNMLKVAGGATQTCTGTWKVLSYVEGIAGSNSSVSRGLLAVRIA